MKLTQNFWKKMSNYEVFVSYAVVAEINKWDDPAKLKLKKLIKGFKVLSIDDKNIITLTKKYIQEKIIPASHELDATHIAVAVVNNIDILLSWNFKHIVRKRVKLGVNYINNLLAYDSIEIMTPAELS
ncbi:PIN domain nuclease, partial [Patescibacteria group bacterium AH-259-L07]|nr:PIN domain nuclease [Patescibacteria group bacterium AH-259-L07]